MAEYKISLRFAYEWRREEEWNAPGYRNPHLTFWYVLQGSRILHFDHYSYTLQPGDFAVIPAHSTFSTEQSKEEPNSIHYLSLGAYIQVNGMDWSELFGVPHICHIGMPTSKALLNTRWRDLIHSNTLVNEAETEAIETNLAKFLSIQMELDAHCRLWFAEAGQLLLPHMKSPNPIVDERVRRVCSFIAGRYPQSIDVSMMARLVNLSEGHLRLLFRKAVGISPYQHLLKVRMEKAKELLLFSETPLSEVAAKVGFEDYSHFQAAFRQMEGLSPSYYRKNNKLGT